MRGIVSEPTAEDVLSKMAVGERYSIDELAAEFHDTFSSTIRRRLDALLNQGKVRKKRHADTRVSWWVPRNE